MPSTVDLSTLVNDLAAVVIAATHREMRAASNALATAIRHQHPTATSIRLTDSDQGDWLCAEEWLSRETGEWEPIELDLLDEVGHLASHLYLPHLDAVAGLNVTDGRPGRGVRYTLTVDDAIATAETRPLIEILIIRDPDGPTTVTTALAGVQACTLGVKEVHVDAGAGWEWQNWAEHRDAALTGASAAIRGDVAAAFSDPPGGLYIEGRGDHPWLPEGL